MCAAMQGNNQTANGIISASITCNTVDGTDVLMYMGASLLKFAANFKGHDFSDQSLPVPKSDSDFETPYPCFVTHETLMKRQLEGRMFSPLTPIWSYLFTSVRPDMDPDRILFRILADKYLPSAMVQHLRVHCMRPWSWPS